MSPERAEEIFYEVYRAGLWHFTDKPVLQRELRLACWAAVVEAVRREVMAEMSGGAD